MWIKYNETVVRHLKNREKCTYINRFAYYISQNIIPEYVLFLFEEIRLDKNAHLKFFFACVSESKYTLMQENIIIYRRACICKYCGT